MRSTTLFVQCLEAHGIQHIFGVPGEENLDLLESLRTSTIKLIVTRNEQTAVFMAATYGRLTGKIGVALATLGPGATNMMTGIAYAQLGGMPVLAITGQKPIRQSKQARFQIIDVVGMMKPITKFSTSITDGARIPTIFAQACMLAEQERPGAVHIELPEDIAEMDVAETCKPLLYATIRRPIPDEKAIQLLVQKLEQATAPIFLIGGGANRKMITKYLTQLIQTYNIPFFTSQMGKGVVDERLPQYIGTAAVSSNDTIHDVIAQADLILAVGHDTIEKPTHILEQQETDIVHINFFVAEVDELYKPSLQIIGDIGNTMRQLTQKKIDTHRRSFSSLYATTKKIQTNTAAEEQSSCMLPGKLITAIRAILREKDILALDNGLYKVRFARNYPCYAPNTLLLDNAFATMGAGYSSALVAKILHPDCEVVAVVGDGGLVMNCGDLETAVRLQIDLTIIVLNDNAYGMIKQKQENRGYPMFGLDLPNPDFVKLAESFGIKGYYLSHPDDFSDLLKKAIQQKGIKLIEVPFSYPNKIR